MAGYQISRFAACLPVKESNIGLLAVYHTMTEAFILIPTDQWNNILKLTPDEDPESIELLASQGILVDKKADETVVFTQWKDRYVHDFSTLRSKVLVTRQCNNRCTYCIIDPEAGVMSAETALAMDAFYLEQIERHKPRQVKDDYLGGEPLLNTNVILDSAGRRFYFCSGRQIDYGFSITTNGTLLRSKIIDQLKAVGLTSVRVSMAGPAEVHDTLRPLKNGAGTYNTIIENLEQISESVDLLIECQYDAGNNDYQQIPEMLDDLARRSIQVAEITFTPILAKRGSDSFCAGMGEVEKYLFLKDQARQHGFNVGTAPPSNACMADFRSIFVFDTNGELIPCPSLQGGEMGYGTVTTGIDFVAEAQLLVRSFPEKCLNRCELLPICMGGCRLQALTHGHDFNGIDCHYDTYRALLEEYIRDSAAAALAEEKDAA